jgi:two-component sensor histidine kinase
MKTSFFTVRGRKDGSSVDVSLTVSPVRDRHVRIAGASKITRHIAELKRAQERQAMLLAESKHRMKNTLATVQAIAGQTLRSLDESEREAFFGRLRALSVAHDLMTIESWDRARLRDLVERVLQPFSEGGQFDIHWPGEVSLDASKSSLLSMILHELATNAAKYGALSTCSGKVKLAWTVVEADGCRRLRLHWQESGGPPVTPPERKGFGLLLLERAVDQQGSTCLKFDPSGFVCELELALQGGPESP